MGEQALSGAPPQAEDARQSEALCVIHGPFLHPVDDVHMDCPGCRADDARKLNEYAEHTRDVLIPELERLSVPWRYFAWRKLSNEIKRRNEYVRVELAKQQRRFARAEGRAS